jgi:hypothetical protein
MGNLIVKPAHGSIEWLRLRHRDEDGRPVISASDAAAVHGEHRFKTRHQLFAEKQAPEPPISITNAAMERGNRLEPVIRDWAADRLGVRLVEPSYMYAIENDTAPMLATLDAVDEWSYENQPDQPAVVVEIKTYNREWDGVLPRYWYWQGVQQALCANVETITWAVFDATLSLHLYEQHVTEDEALEHIRAVQDFVFWLRMGEPNPEWPATYDDIQATYPQALSGVADLSEHAHLLGELKDVQARKKEMSATEDELKAKIAGLLGDADTGTVDGATVVTWKNQSRSSFDSKGFSADHPDLAEKYTKSSTFRVLRVKGEK